MTRVSFIKCTAAPMPDPSPSEHLVPKPGRERLDAALAARGLCDSREQAKRLILAGEILVNGHRCCQARTSGEARTTKSR